MPPNHRSIWTAILAAATWIAAPCVGAMAAPAPAPASAQSVRASQLIVTAPWSRATPPGASVAVVYLAIRNGGSTPDRLLGAAAPIAAKATIHETRDVGGVMEMRAVGTVVLPPGKTVRLEPSGLHLMLTGLKRPLRAGMRFPLRLRFARAGSLTVLVPVRADEP